MWQVRELRHPRAVYSQLMDLLARLAAKGLIHCDFNEFNLLARACLGCSAGFLHNARTKYGNAVLDIAWFVAPVSDIVARLIWAWYLAAKIGAPCNSRLLLDDCICCINSQALPRVIAELLCLGR